MWNNLASPPDNFRFYQYSGDQPTKDINLEQNKTTLFQPKLRNTKRKDENSDSPFNTGEAFSINTSHKNPSSQKSTIKVNNRNHQSAYDLKMKGRRNGHHRQQSKSMRENKQKSSMNLSQKMQSTSVIREEGSRMSSSSKNGRSFLKRVENQEEEQSISQIFANEVSLARNSVKQKENLISMEGSYFLEMVSTLRQIRDISKESLITKKKLVKLLEDRNQVSFLYQKEDRSDLKAPNKNHKNGRKSIKRNNEKSTIKKLGKSIILEERLGKVEEKLRALSRKVDEDLQPKKASTIGLGKTTKKSTSALR